MSAAPRGWQWDGTLFRGAAAYYDRGRLPYAPNLADALRELRALLAEASSTGMLGVQLPANELKVWRPALTLGPGRRTS